VKANKQKTQVSRSGQKGLRRYPGVETTTELVRGAEALKNQKQRKNNSSSPGERYQKKLG